MFARRCFKLLRHRFDRYTFSRSYLVSPLSNQNLFIAPTTFALCAGSRFSFFPFFPRTFSLCLDALDIQFSSDIVMLINKIYLIFNIYIISVCIVSIQAFFYPFPPRSTLGYWAELCRTKSKFSSIFSIYIQQSASIHWECCCCCCRRRLCKDETL